MTATSLPRARRLRAALRLAPLAATLAILTGLSCFGDPAGPDFKPTARFSFVPTFSSSAAMRCSASQRSRSVEACEALTFPAHRI